MFFEIRQLSMLIHLSGSETQPRFDSRNLETPQISHFYSYQSFKLKSKKYISWTLSRHSSVVKNEFLSNHAFW